MIDYLTLLETMFPFIVFFLTLLDSVPFVGLALPEEMILASIFLVSSTPLQYFTIWISSVLAMVIGQSIVFVLSKRYGYKLLNIFRFNETKIKKLEDFIDTANFRDHILLRISPNSMFRITAAFFTGFRDVDFRTHFKYEIVASTIKTSIYLVIGLSLRAQVSEIDLSQLIARIGMVIFLITVVSLFLSYRLNLRINKGSS